jgi:hypothetical protein
MAKRILWGIVGLIVVAFFYVGYTTYDAGRTLSSGDVRSADSASRSKNSSAIAEPDAHPAPGQPIVYPAPNEPGGSAIPSPVTGQVAQPGGSTVPPTGAVPPGDTIAPNPPNGMVFAGTGRYQLYRQGNITWRLDTNTGHSCILFATDEEWKRPRVLQAGCGKS